MSMFCFCRTGFVFVNPGGKIATEIQRPIAVVNGCTVGVKYLLEEI